MSSQRQLTIAQWGTHFHPASLQQDSMQMSYNFSYPSSSPAPSIALPVRFKKIIQMFTFLALLHIKLESRGSVIFIFFSLIKIKLHDEYILGAQLILLVQWMNKWTVASFVTLSDPLKQNYFLLHVTVTFSIHLQVFSLCTWFSAVFHDVGWYVFFVFILLGAGGTSRICDLLSFVSLENSW